MSQKERRVSIWPVHRNPPDLKKLARALIELAEQQLAVEREAAAAAADRADRPDDESGDGKEVA
jgi:hypothetical protein